MDVFLISLLASSILAPTLLESLHPYYVALRRVQGGQLREALPFLDRTIAWQLHMDEAYLLRAFVYSQLNDLGRAVEDYDTLIRMRPRSAMGFLGRAKVYHIQGHMDVALRDYDDAIDILPDLVEAYYGRAMARLYMGFSTAAAEDIARWLRMEGWGKPTSPFAAIIGFLAWRQAGNAAAAGALLAEAVTHVAAEASPAPLFQFLQGRLDANELVTRARTPLEAVHAYTTIGLNYSYAGHGTAALPYLQWVEANGVKVPEDHAYELARRELERLRGR